MRSNFEKAYEPNPHKSPFTEVRFNEEKQIYEPLNPPVDRVARSLNAAWYGYRIRQTEVDELTLQVAEMKSRLNDAYADGQSAMCTARQSKIDELTKQRDSFIKAYEIEMDESVELRKRVDAVKTLIEEYKDPPTEDKAFRYALSIVAYELEQALNGGK